MEEGKYKEALKVKDPGEDPGMDFERTAPGEAPKAQEYTAQEFAEEAPTLQEPTEKELFKLRRKEIYKQLQAGIDVKGNIAKAKKNRETTDFFKTFTAGNMTMEQVWSHPWAADNPKQVATMISNMQKTQRDQFADVNEKNVLASINAAGTDVNALQAIQNSPEYTSLSPSSQRTLNNEIQSQIGKAETKFKNLETTKRNITGHLFNLGQTTAEGTPITEDDPKTPEDESLTVTSGESISNIIEENPQGISSDQLTDILGHVDKIKQSVGDEPLDMSDYDPDDAIGSLKILLGINEKAGGSKEVTKLLKELLKLPIIAQEGLLSEEIEKPPTVETKETKQTGGFPGFE